MARLLQRLGLFSARNKYKVVFSWILALVLLTLSSSIWAGETSKTLTLKGQESTIALDLMDKSFGSNSDLATAKVTFEEKSGKKITEVVTSGLVASKVAELSKLPGVISVSNPYDPQNPTISPDLKVAFATVTYGVAAPEMTEEERTALTNATETSERSALQIGAFGTAMEGEAGEVSPVGELVGIAVALLVLLITFGSLAAAGMNLITALLGVGIGAVGITLATGFIDLTSTTPVLATMLGLAVGIDYALFIVARFRHELFETRDIHSSVGVAVATAGSAVFTAGITVVLALAGLSVVGIEFLTQMGVAAAATVIVAVIAALTLVPATLAILGYRVLSRTQRNFIGNTKSTSMPDKQNPIFDRWVERIVKHPLAIASTIVLVLGLATVPVFSMETSLVPSQKPGSIQAVGEKALEEHFGAGINSPIVIYAEGTAAKAVSEANAAAIQKMKNIAFVTPVLMSADQSAGIVTVIPRSKANSQETQALVSMLRSKVESNKTTKSYVTGSTAVSVDISTLLNKALPIYLLLVGGLALLLLIMVFRSIWVPLIGVLGFLLTIGSALGASVAVFQQGHLSGIFGVEKAPLMSITPILAIGILFGLAMDYQVFLVSRIHEAQSHGDSPTNAIRHGYHKAAPIVLAAASIMFAVFAGFFPGGDSTIMQISFVLAFGVFVDAILVRMILVPAALQLLGARAWSFPRWLNWLPEMDVEGHGIEKSKA